MRSQMISCSPDTPIIGMCTLTQQYRFQNMLFCDGKGVQPKSYIFRHSGRQTGFSFPYCLWMFKATWSCRMISKISDIGRCLGCIVFSASQVLLEINHSSGKRHFHLHAARTRMTVLFLKLLHLKRTRYKERKWKSVADPEKTER